MTTAVRLSIEEDFAAWADETADLLEARRFDEVDFSVLAEEVRDLGLSKLSAVESQLTRLFIHLIKWEYQPARRSRSWRVSIGSARVEIAKEFRRSPSLRRKLSEAIAENWEDARKLASLETEIPARDLPEECPWDFESQVLGEDWLP